MNGPVAHAYRQIERRITPLTPSEIRRGGFQDSHLIKVVLSARKGDMRDGFSSDIIPGLSFHDRVLVGMPFNNVEGAAQVLRIGYLENGTKYTGEPYQLVTDSLPTIGIDDAGFSLKNLVVCKDITVIQSNNSHTYGVTQTTQGKPKQILHNVTLSLLDPEEAGLLMKAYEEIGKKKKKK